MSTHMNDAVNIKVICPGSFVWLFVTYNIARKLFTDSKAQKSFTPNGGVLLLLLDDLKLSKQCRANIHEEKLRALKILQIKHVPPLGRFEKLQ